MNTITPKKSLSGKMLLGMLAMMVCTFVQAQVTVTVPITFEVVVAGTGGTLGLGGKVGNNGVVVMPDPGDGDFTINDDGTILHNWRLWGDLSFDDDEKNQLKSATTAPTSIYSYNANIRGSETSELARSKGRMYISYDRGGCASYVEFDVFKQYSSSLPPIVGESCWIPDKAYTYSVDQIASDNLGDEIGVDDYYWTIYKDNIPQTEELLLYYSADKSSITLQTPTDISGDWYIECCFGRANPWGGPPSSCVTMTIGVEPVKPSLDMPACVSVGESSLVIEVINPVAGYIYEWSSINTPWRFFPETEPNSGIGTGSEITVNNLGSGAGTVYLTVKNPLCGEPVEFEYPLNRYFTPAVSILAEETCLTPGESYTFSIDPSVADFNNYTKWLIDNDPIEENTPWKIDINGINTNLTHSVVDIIVPETAIAGDYTLKAYSCSDTNFVFIPITVRPKTPQKAINSDFENICMDWGSTDTIQLSVTPPGINYQWTIPPNWSGNSTTETITLTPNGENGGTISVMVLDDDGCSSAPVSWEAVFPDFNPTRFTLGGCWDYDIVNENVVATNTITVSGVPIPFTGDYIITPEELVYDYSIDGNGIITLTVFGDVPVDNDDEIIGLKIAYEGCGTSEPVDFPLTFDANGIILSYLENWAGNDLYSVNSPSSTPVRWTVDGVEVTGNTSTILILPHTGSAPEVCAEVEIDGCTTILCTPNETPAFKTGVFENNLEILNRNNQINIYPNPNKGTFSIDLEKVNKSAEVKVFDVQGRLVSEHTLKKGENILNESVSTGTYMLLIDVDGKISAHKIQINN